MGVKAANKLMVRLLIIAYDFQFYANSHFLERKNVKNHTFWNEKV
jgi:hypothetical protein